MLTIWFCSDSPIKLQNMINAICKYCYEWSLNINLTKTKVVVFSKGTRIPYNFKWNFQNMPIEVVNEYKYLGITLTFICYKTFK